MRNYHVFRSNLDRIIGYRNEVFYVHFYSLYDCLILNKLRLLPLNPYLLTIYNNLPVSFDAIYETESLNIPKINGLYWLGMTVPIQTWVLMTLCSWLICVQIVDRWMPSEGEHERWIGTDLEGGSCGISKYYPRLAELFEKHKIFHPHNHVTLPRFKTDAYQINFYLNRFKCYLDGELPLLLLIPPSTFLDTGIPANRSWRYLIKPYSALTINIIISPY